MQDRNNRDVRSLLLCKTLLNGNNFLEQSKINNHLLDVSSVTLGDYDGMFVYHIQEQPQNLKLLTMIEQENAKLAEMLTGSAFYHPFYAIYNYSEHIESEDHTSPQEAVDQFWIDTPDGEESNFNFFFSTMIYLRPVNASHKEKSTYREAIFNHLCGLKEEREDFRFIVYHSLDLCDFIIFWKSASIRPVARALQSLCGNESAEIGYSKTVCGINYRNLSRADFDLSRIPEEDDGDNEEVNIVNIQAAARSHVELSHLIEHVMTETGLARSETDGKERFFVLGDYDFLGSFHKATSRDLFKLFQFMTKQEIYNRVFAATASINTQVGIPFTYLPIPAEDLSQSEPSCQEERLTENEQLYSLCLKLHEKLQTTAQDIIAKGHPWVKVILELSNQLVMMSKSYVHDKVCFLLLDSVCALSAWLEKNKGDAEKLQIYEEVIGHYVRGWNRLIDHVVRSDGSLLQSPGYDPIQYNMCVSILEYCIAYFNYVSQYLSAFDGQSTVLDHEALNNPCLISPKLCRRIKTLQIFGESNSGAEPTLIIDLPVSNICDPFLVLASLTHESAHFFGESIRIREERYRILTLCIASEFCLYCNLYSNSAIKRLSDNLLKKMEEEGRVANSGYQLKPLLDDLFIIIDYSQRDFSFVGSLYDAYLSDYCADGQPISHAEKKHIIDNITKRQFLLLSASGGVNGNLFYGVVRNISYLLKECFADIIMNRTLNLTIDDYLRVLSADFHRLSSISDGSNYAEGSYAKTLLFQRILLVQMACKSINLEGFKEEANPNAFEESTTCKNIVEEYRKFAQNFESGFDPDKRFNKTDSSPNSLLSNYTMTSLLRYLQVCLLFIRKKEQSLKESDGGQSNLQQKIYNQFHGIATHENFFTQDFHDTLYQNRKNILNRLTTFE